MRFFKKIQLILINNLYKKTPKFSFVQNIAEFITKSSFLRFQTNKISNFFQIRSKSSVFQHRFNHNLLFKQNIIKTTS